MNFNKPINQYCSHFLINICLYFHIATGRICFRFNRFHVVKNFNSIFSNTLCVFSTILIYFINLSGIIYLLHLLKFGNSERFRIYWWFISPMNYQSCVRSCLTSWWLLRLIDILIRNSKNLTPNGKSIIPWLRICCSSFLT